MPKIAIIGGGRGGLALISVLKDNDHVDLVGVCDVNETAPGLIEAARLGIDTYTDFEEMLHGAPEIDLLINVTADPSLPARLERHEAAAGLEIIHGATAALLWELIAAQQRLILDAGERMDELKDLYHLGLKLSASADLNEVYECVIRNATRMTGTPAGSVALLDESAGEMVLAYAEGFSDSFNNFERWRLRPGGLTNYILNQNEPVVIPDIAAFEERINPALVREGVHALMACPLTARGKIIGILYVDDFIKRDFSDREVSILGLLSGYAALSIEKMKLLDDTRKMAITDGLTGLRNQQEFLARLESETERAKRYGRNLSVMALDIDFFKSYNDEFGHLAGNDLLRVLARVLTDSCRQADFCARIGGEEFGVIMPETGVREAVRLAERVRLAIGNMYEANTGIMRKSITVSVGVAAYPDHGDLPNKIYRSADDALYKAKQAGRNQVRVYPAFAAGPFLAP